MEEKIPLLANSLELVEMLEIDLWSARLVSCFCIRSPLSIGEDNGRVAFRIEDLSERFVLESGLLLDQSEIPGEVQFDVNELFASRAAVTIP